MATILRMQPTPAGDSRRLVIGILVSSDCSRLATTIVACAGRGLDIVPEIVDGMTAEVPAETASLFQRFTGPAIAPADAAEMLTTLRTRLAELQAAVVNALLAQAGVAPSLGDAPATGVGQSQGSAIGAIEDSVSAADNLKANLNSMAQGVTIAGTLSTSQATTSLQDATNSVYKGRLLVWTSGALLRFVSYITGYDGATKKLTFGTLPFAPALGDSFIIV